MLLAVHLNDIDCLKTILPNSCLHTDKAMEDTLEILDIFGIWAHDFEDAPNHRTAISIPKAAKQKKEVTEFCRKFKTVAKYQEDLASNMT